MGAILAQKVFPSFYRYEYWFKKLDICLGMENRIVYDISDVTWDMPSKNKLLLKTVI